MLGGGEEKVARPWVRVVGEWRREGRVGIKAMGGRKGGW